MHLRHVLGCLPCLATTECQFSLHVQTLEGAQGRDGIMLLDNVGHVLDFVGQICGKTNLAWSVHVGGGNSYKCQLYAHSNAVQMCATEVDMLKAALLSSESANIACTSLLVCNSTMTLCCWIAQVFWLYLSIMHSSTVSRCCKILYTVQVATLNFGQNCSCLA